MSRIGMPIAGIMTALVLMAAVLPVCAEDPPVPNTAPPPAHHKPHHTQKKAPPPLVLPPLPPGPLQQVPMDKIPATAPVVTYENGQLTIVADNSTLGSILKDVRQLTGATIDLPPNGAPERVVTHVGPGAPRDVLAVLLNGTQFNYVMLGSSSDPSAVSTVLLSPKPSSGDTQTVANAAYQGNAQAPNGGVLPRPFRQQMLAQQQQAAAQAEDSTSADDSDAADDSDPNQQAQPNQPETPQPDANNNNANAGDQANQPNGGPKTPEQMLEMMRQRIPGAQQPGQPGPLNPPPNATPPDQ
jgi:hypothetical protein